VLFLEVWYILIARRFFSWGESQGERTRALLRPSERGACSALSVAMETLQGLPAWESPSRLSIAERLAALADSRVTASLVGFLPGTYRDQILLSPNRTGYDVGNIIVVVVLALGLGRRRVVLCWAGCRCGSSWLPVVRLRHMRS
jgi:hypothetical protein